MIHDSSVPLLESSLYPFKMQLDTEGILFCYCGPLSQALLESIGNSLRSHIMLPPTELNTTRKLFSTFVEMMQNIVHYSAPKLAPEYYSGFEFSPEGILVIGKRTEHYFVYSGNWILIEDAQRLQQKLSTLQTMTKEQLRAFYKEQRRKSPEATSKGAGLGFIEMARQSSHIAFNIQPINTTHAFFTLKVDF